MDGKPILSRSHRHSTLHHRPSPKISSFIAGYCRALSSIPIIYDSSNLHTPPPEKIRDQAVSGWNIFIAGRKGRKLNANSARKYRAPVHRSIPQAVITKSASQSSVLFQCPNKPYLIILLSSPPAFLSAS